MSFHYCSPNKWDLLCALKELEGKTFRDIGIDSQSLEAKNVNENLP